MGLFFLDGCNEAAKIIKCSCEATSATNMNDISITGFVCITIVIISIIAALTLLAWKIIEIDAKTKEREYEMEKERIEQQVKKIARNEDRRQMLEDDDRKQKNDLLKKKLDILHAFCYNECTRDQQNKETKEYEKKLKQRDAVEVKEYIVTINNLLRSATNPTPLKDEKVTPQN